MSSEENEPEKPVEDEHLEMLSEYHREISNNFEDIKWVFEDSFESDRVHNDYNDYFSTMHITLVDVVEEGDERELANSLIHATLNYSPALDDELDSISGDLAGNIRKLSSQFGLPIQRRTQRIQQGHNYWSNVKSDIGVRSDQPNFEHEIIIDYNERISFDSGLHGTSVLARHYLEQVNRAASVLGEDVLSSIDQNEIKRINELSEQLLEDIEEYEPLEDVDFGEADDEDGTIDDPDSDNEE